MLNIKLLLAYDGKGYLGWQKTRMGPSVEDVLQRTLEQILQEEISLQAASRTDAGVHAHGQVVNFFSSKEIVPEKLQIGLNSLLCKDIVIRKIEIVEESFHPTLNNCGKEYHYYVCTGPIQLPQNRHYSWHCPDELNLAAMFSASQMFIGTHDFAAFCNFKKNAGYESTVRTLTSIEMVEIPEKRLLIKITGDSFLYKMVRNLVGSLVQVGRGMIPIDQIEQIIASKDRRQAGVTAPAHGLVLHRVFY